MRDMLPVLILLPPNEDQYFKALPGHRGVIRFWPRFISCSRLRLVSIVLIKIMG